MYTTSKYEMILHTDNKDVFRRLDDCICKFLDKIDPEGKLGIKTTKLTKKGKKKVI